MVEPKFTRPVKTANGWPGVTKVNFKHPGIQYPWKFHCPQALCFFVVVAATEEILNERIETHPCPWYGGGTTTFSWGVMSDEYLEPIWAKLDAEVDTIKAETTDYPTDKFTQARYRARGLAEALAILMPPFFTTGDEIVREAMVRWEKRQAGQPYETPGIGRFKWNRPPGVIGDPNNPSWVDKAEYDASQPKPAPKHNLTDAQIAQIKASKNFPVRMLAKALDTDEAVIKYFQAQGD